MNQIMVDTMGMWCFCFYAVQDWAVSEGYRWPSEEYIKANVTSYYIFEFDKDTTIGDHTYQSGKHVIRIKVGLKFAHLVQSYNLGEEFHKLYEAQQSSVGYDNNVYEKQARRAGKFADDLYSRRILHWYSDIHTVRKGVHSQWPKPKPKPAPKGKKRYCFGGMWGYVEIRYHRLNKHEKLLLRQAWKTNRWLHEHAAKRALKGARHGRK
jgi:hypothetical protein